MSLGVKELTEVVSKIGSTVFKPEFDLIYNFKTSIFSIAHQITSAPAAAPRAC